jgi:two-component system, NtrC family, response regulator AtoC
VYFFIERYNKRFRKSVRGITPETRDLLVKYDWPGNVRELKNAIERAMILEDDDMLRPVYLPFSVGSPLSNLTAFEVSSGGNVAAGAGYSPGQTETQVQVVNGKNLPRLSIPEGGTSLEEIERTFVEMAMQQASRNQTQAAKLLDISRDALRYKLKKFGLMHSEDEEVSTPPR